MRPPHVAGGAGRLPLGFSTLGSPKWTWTQTLDFAAANGFAGIELRGLEQTMDLSKRPEFQPDRVAQTKRELAARGLAVPCLGASVNLHEQDTAKLGAAMAETRRFIDVASGLGAPYVRVFGNSTSRACLARPCTRTSPAGCASWASTLGRAASWCCSNRMATSSPRLRWWT